MDHSEHFVDLLNPKGEVVGQKRRRDIQKAHDMYHTVFVFMVTPGGQLVLGKIPARTDLPNLYANLLGVPVAAIRRSTETAEQAAKRAVKRELFIENPKLTLLGEEFLQFNDGHRTFASVFVLVGEAPRVFSKTDVLALKTLTPEQLNAKISHRPNSIALSLQKIWQLYKQHLPI